MAAALKQLACMDYMNNTCTRGTKCIYSHDVRNPTPCINFNNGTPCLSTCFYVHVYILHLLELYIYENTKPQCYMFNNVGNCNNGNMCIYLHVPRQPYVKSKELCKHHEMLNFVNTIPECGFGHYTGDRMVCYTFNDTGTCTKGNTCTYKHIPVQLHIYNRQMAPMFPGNVYMDHSHSEKMTNQTCAQFFKTGYCGNGNECLLLHRPSQSRVRFRGNSTAPYNPDGCRVFNDTSGHNVDELIQCKHFNVNGKCYNGNRCIYEHIPCQSLVPGTVPTGLPASPEFSGTDSLENLNLVDKIPNNSSDSDVLKSDTTYSSSDLPDSFTDTESTDSIKSLDSTIHDDDNRDAVNKNKIVRPSTLPYNNTINLNKYVSSDRRSSEIFRYLMSPTDSSEISDIESTKSCPCINMVNGVSIVIKSNMPDVTDFNESITSHPYTGRIYFG